MESKELIEQIIKRAKLRSSGFEILDILDNGHIQFYYVRYHLDKDVIYSYFAIDEIKKGNVNEKNNLLLITIITDKEDKKADMENIITNVFV